MATTQSFDYSIDTDKPCLFLADRDNNIYKHLQKTMVGKCYMGCYILEIIELNRVSGCRIINTNHNAIGVINLVFTAHILQYFRDDIIPDIEICSHNSSKYGKNQNCIVSFTDAPIHGLLVEKMIIPIRVIDVKYETGSDVMTMCGEFLTLTNNKIAYKINSELIDSDKEHILKLLEEVENISIPATSTFTELVCYGANKTPIRNAITSNNVGKIFNRNTHFDLNVNIVEDSENVVNVSALNVWVMMIMHSKITRTLIKDLTEIYTDKTKHKKVLELLKSTRK